MTESAQDSALHNGAFTSPSLSHSTAFTPSKASGVCRTASQTDAKAMGQLVDDDAGFKIAIAVWVCSVP